MFAWAEPAGAAQDYQRSPGAACAPLPPSYRRREPEKTVLHGVVREHLATFLAGAREEGHGFGLPRFVERDLTRYLACGILGNGFARVRCGACGHELLVAFSCKGRGTCPSCNARRMHDTAAHLVDRVLPRAPYRQWVLSLPRRVRYLLAGDPGLASRVLRLFLRALATWQRKQARALLVADGRTGAITFMQRFGGALNLNVHFHCIVPEGVFTEGADGEAVFHDVPAPDDADVEAILCKVVARVHKLLERRGLFDDAPEGALAGMHAEAAQAGLFRPAEPEEPRHGRRAAFLEGYSLHAGVWIHENDRAGLERLCKYGARPALALDRLSRLPDGRLAYRVKRRGAGLLVLEPLQFLRKLAALVPPPRAHLTRYHGVFAPAARLRRAVRPAPPAPEPPQATAAPALLTPRAPPEVRERRLNWAALLQRVYATDVLACGKCGGRMRVMAFVTDPDVARAILDHLGLPATAPPQAAARGPPQRQFDRWDQSAEA